MSTNIQDYKLNFLLLKQADSCLSLPPQSSWPRDDDQQDHLSLDEISQIKESPLVAQDSQEEGEDVVAEGTNKFYCYLCSITCHNQQVS